MKEYSAEFTKWLLSEVFQKKMESFGGIIQGTESTGSYSYFQSQTTVTGKWEKTSVTDVPGHRQDGCIWKGLIVSALGGWIRKGAERPGWPTVCCLLAHPSPPRPPDQERLLPLCF